MRKTINIGDKEVTFEANAASFPYAKRIFKKEHINAMTAENMDYDLIINLAFIFAKQAEMMDGKMTRNEFLSLTEDDKFNWLEQFETMDIYFMFDSVSELIAAESKTTSIPKKRGV